VLGGGHTVFGDGSIKVATIATKKKKRHFCALDAPQLIKLINMNHKNTQSLVNR
jgi:hypothetical protein